MEHPVFGWVRYREWALLGYVERLVEKIGPLELVAWIGLTYQYSQTIKTAGDLAGWLNQLGGDIGDAFSQVGQFVFGAAIPETTEAVGGFFGGLGGGFQDVLGGLGGIVGGTAMRYFWAAVAAAITILTVKGLP